MLGKLCPLYNHQHVVILVHRRKQRKKREARFYICGKTTDAVPMLILPMLSHYSLDLISHFKFTFDYLQQYQVGC